MLIDINIFICIAIGAVAFLAFVVLLIVCSQRDEQGQGRRLYQRIWRQCCGAAQNEEQTSLIDSGHATTRYGSPDTSSLPTSQSSVFSAAPSPILLSPHPPATTLAPSSTSANVRPTDKVLLPVSTPIPDAHTISRPLQAASGGTEDMNMAAGFHDNLKTVDRDIDRESDQELDENSLKRDVTKRSIGLQHEKKHQHALPDLNNLDRLQNVTETLNEMREDKKYQHALQSDAMKNREELLGSVTTGEEEHATIDHGDSAHCSRDDFAVYHAISDIYSGSDHRASDMAKEKEGVPKKTNPEKLNNTTGHVDSFKPLDAIPPQNLVTDAVTTSLHTDPLVGLSRQISSESKTLQRTASHVTNSEKSFGIKTVRGTELEADPTSETLPIADVSKTEIPNHKTISDSMQNVMNGANTEMVNGTTLKLRAIDKPSVPDVTSAKTIVSEPKVDRTPLSEVEINIPQSDLPLTLPETNTDFHQTSEESGGCGRSTFSAPSSMSPSLPSSEFLIQSEPGVKTDIKSSTQSQESSESLSMTLATDVLVPGVKYSSKDGNHDLSCNAHNITFSEQNGSHGLLNQKTCHQFESSDVLSTQGACPDEHPVKCQLSTPGLNISPQVQHHPRVSPLHTQSKPVSSSNTSPNKIPDFSGTVQSPKDTSVTSEQAFTQSATVQITSPYKDPEKAESLKLREQQFFTVTTPQDSECLQGETAQAIIYPQVIEHSSECISPQVTEGSSDVASSQKTGNSSEDISPQASRDSSEDTVSIKKTEDSSDCTSPQNIADSSEDTLFPQITVGSSEGLISPLNTSDPSEDASPQNIGDTSEDTGDVSPQDTADYSEGIHPQEDTGSGSSSLSGRAPSEASLASSYKSLSPGGSSYKSLTSLPDYRSPNNSSDSSSTVEHGSSSGED